MTSTAADLLERELTPAPPEVTTSTPGARTGRGRVWKAPRPARGRGGLTAVAVTTTMIGLGALTLTHATDMPPAAASTDALAPGSMHRVVDQIGARSLWAQGITGDGVTVAVIDTGIAPVDGLRDQVVAAVDLSAEYDDPTAAFTDNHGHGTHLAGIVAGRDPGGPVAAGADDPERFLGVAPDARLVSIKVAGRDGSVHPSAVVAAVDWAIAHRDELGIRVLNVAIDVDVDVPYVDDPLASAVERAWHAGIVVVTAAGNSGDDGRLGTPSHDPFVIAVGSVEVGDDGIVVPDWTSSGDGIRNPDVVAPGAHIASLLAPGSAAALEHPEGIVDARRIRATGTSQSAAVVSGVAALLLDADPTLTPDQIKDVLTRSAATVPGASDTVVGSGMVRADAAVELAAGSEAAAPQRWERAVGDATVLPDGAVPTLWMGNAWMGNAWMGNAWMGNAWMGNAWMGNAWMGNAWMGNAWMGNAWMGNAWMGNAWMGNAWMGNAWMGNAWMGNAWMGNAWMGNAWMGNAWMGNAWMGNAWMGNAWM